MSTIQVKVNCVFKTPRKLNKIKFESRHFRGKNHDDFKYVTYKMASLSTSFVKQLVILTARYLENRKRKKKTENCNNCATKGITFTRWTTKRPLLIKLAASDLKVLCGA